MNIRFRTIATGGPAAYLRPVLLTRLIRFLAILALAMSPLAAIGVAPASAAAHHAGMTASASQTADHQMMSHDMAGDASRAACQDMDGKSKDQPCGSDSRDCVKACAAVPAIPAVGGQLGPQLLDHGPQRVATLVSVPHGLVPEAATPPPRGLLKI
ncbi:MAG TPA: hypothetical protein VFP12_10290 [Allosphingosinicella sp.]|nr:hypothetical protein [Allosphingosinicella sp.]